MNSNKKIPTNFNNKVVKRLFDENPNLIISSYDDFCKLYMSCRRIWGGPRLNKMDFELVKKFVEGKLPVESIVKEKGFKNPESAFRFIGKAINEMNTSERSK